MVQVNHKPTDEEVEKLFRCNVDAGLKAFASSAASGHEPCPLILLHRADGTCLIDTIEDFPETSRKRQEHLFLLGRSLKARGEQVQVCIITMLAIQLVLDPDEEIPESGTLQLDPRGKEIVCSAAMTHDGRLATAFTGTGRSGDGFPMNYEETKIDFEWLPGSEENESQLLSAFWNGYHYEPPNSA